MPNSTRPRSATLVEGYHVLAESSSLRLVLACGVPGMHAFSRDDHLDAPGVYVALSASAYVGCSTRSVSARTQRLTVGGSTPDALLALVGGREPLDENDARALERIAFQAYERGGVPLRNLAYPDGAPVGHARYAELQGIWAEAVAALREGAPALALPWQGPDYLSPPLQIREAEEALFATRWRGRMVDATATLRSCGIGYVVEAGSTLRLEPVTSAPGLCQTLREELAFMGVLVREPRVWRLTRDLHMPTLSACARVVFTSRSSGYWQVVDDEESGRFEPAFTPITVR